MGSIASRDPFAFSFGLALRAAGLGPFSRLLSSGLVWSGILLRKGERDRARHFVSGWAVGVACGSSKLALLEFLCEAVPPARGANWPGVAVMHAC